MRDRFRARLDRQRDRALDRRLARHLFKVDGVGGALEGERLGHRDLDDDVVDRELFARVGKTQLEGEVAGRGHARAAVVELRHDQRRSGRRDIRAAGGVVVIVVVLVVFPLARGGFHLELVELLAEIGHADAPFGRVGD